MMNSRGIKTKDCTASSVAYLFAKNVGISRDHFLRASTNSKAIAAKYVILNSLSKIYSRTKMNKSKHKPISCLDFKACNHKLTELKPK